MKLCVMGANSVQCTDCMHVGLICSLPFDTDALYLHKMLSDARHGACAL